MLLKDIMTTDPLMLECDISVREAAGIFLKNAIDGAVVMDKARHICGLFTKTHIYRCIEVGGSLDSPIRDWMHQGKLRTAHPNDRPEEVLTYNLGRLPIVQDGQVIGMITRSDLARTFLDSYYSVASEMGALLHSVHSIILSIDTEGLIRIFNPAAEACFGVTSEQAIGVHILDIMPESKLLEVVQSGETQLMQPLELNNRRYVVTRSPIIRDGEITGAVTVAQDASEIERISGELQEVNSLNTELNAIIESSYDGLYITDGEGMTLRMNKAFERISGISSEEFKGRHMRNLALEGVISESVSMKVLEHKREVTIVQHYRTGVTALSTGSPVFDEEGKIFRVVTNVRDLTELNRLKQKLDQVEDLNIHYINEIKKLRLQYKGDDRLVTQAVSMKNVLDMVVRIGQVDTTVLITGETGTGKELIADSIHANSHRSDKAFLKLNCGSIPANLLESELFGYSPGAFTGARKQGKAGYFELADNGTLFLDEIAELPLDLQVKLLRVLQSQEIMRVGGERSIKIDVRIIAATNRELKAMVSQKLFREDLFYRLNVVPIELPPLRERSEDISLLATHFISRFNRRFNMNKKLTKPVYEALMLYSWPGNVRELENLIERLVVTSSEDIIDLQDLPAYLSVDLAPYREPVTVNRLMPLKDAVEEVEKQLLIKAGQKFRTTRQMANELQVNASTIVRKASRYGINLNGDD